MYSAGLGFLSSSAHFTGWVSSSHFKQAAYQWGGKSMGLRKKKKKLLWLQKWDFVYLSVKSFCHPVGHLPVSLVKSLLDYFFTHSTNLTPLKPERLLRMQQNEELNLICRKAKSNVAIRGSITSETIFESFMNRFAHLWIISVAFGPIYTL